MATTQKGVSALDVALHLASSEDAVVAFQARVRALGVPESDPTVTALRAAIADSPRARALLSHRAANGTIRLNPYAKFQGPHWTLVCLAQIDYPPGDPGLRPLKRQVDDWLSSREHLRPPRTLQYPEQPERTRRCASQEGNAIWTALRLGLEDDRTTAWVERLIAFQWPDGGWNCDSAGRRGRPRTRRRRSRRARCMRSGAGSVTRVPCAPPTGPPSCCCPGGSCGADATAP
jgi:hypothetical protein